MENYADHLISVDQVVSFLEASLDDNPAHAAETVRALDWDRIARRAGMDRAELYRAVSDKGGLVLTALLEKAAQND